MFLWRVGEQAIDLSEEDMQMVSHEQSEQIERQNGFNVESDDVCILAEPGNILYWFCSSL